MGITQAGACHTQLFDLPAAAQLLRRQADFLDKIHATDRIFRGHYRVAFYGRDFGDSDIDLLVGKGQNAHGVAVSVGVGKYGREFVYVLLHDWSLFLIKYAIVLLVMYFFIFLFFAILIFVSVFIAAPLVAFVGFRYRSGNGRMQESVKDFTDRIKACFPAAQVVNSPDLPPDNVIAPDYAGQYVQIITLVPASPAERDAGMPVDDGLTMPLRVRRYADLPI